MKVTDAADFIILWCKFNQIPITNLKLQNLLFLLNVSYWSDNKKMLFLCEFFTSSVGPKEKTIYEKYKIYGSCELPMPIYSDNFENFFKTEEIEYMCTFLTMFATKNFWELKTQSCSVDEYKYLYEIFGENKLVKIDAN